MTAPTIPMRIVTMMPPGSSPGMISLPNAPAMSPTRIQLMMPTFLRPSLGKQPALGDVPVMRTIPKISRSDARRLAARTGAPRRPGYGLARGSGVGVDGQAVVGVGAEA